MPDTIEKVVGRMMRAFNLNYTGFQIDIPADGQKSIKATQWEILLRDFPVEAIQQATVQIIATRKNEYGWAPDIATVREVCLNLSSGMISTPTGTESWGRILKKINEPPNADNGIELTETEKKALGQTSSLYDMRAGNIQSLPFARRDYIKAFDSLVAKERLEILTPDSVKALVSKNAPELPVPTEKQLPPADDGNVMTYDEAKEIHGPEIEKLKGVIGK